MSVRKYFGLSLTERLTKAGTGHQFSRALEQKNASRMLELMKQIDYSEESASAMVKTFLNSRKS